MSFIDTLKKIFQEEKEEKKEEIIEIDFSQLSSALDAIQKAVDMHKEEIKKNLKDKISDFYIQMQQQIIVLEKINLDKRKEEQKLKHIVNENLKLYIEYLNNLIDDLNKAKELETNAFIKRISEIMNNFNKNSKNSFEKATILIGNELGKTKEIVNNTFRSIEGIIKGSASKQDNMINKTKEMLDSLDTLKKTEEEIRNNLVILNTKKQEAERAIETIKQEAEKAKKSEEYKKELAEKENRQKKLLQLEKQIQEIKQKINFKLLAKHFHNEIKKSKLIQEYIDNFKQAIEKDSGLEIMPLISEFKQIDVNLIEIRNNLLELNENTIGEKENKIKLLDADISKQNSQLIDISQEASQETKRKLRLEEKEKEIIESIKNQVKELNLKVR